MVEEGFKAKPSLAEKLDLGLNDSNLEREFEILKILDNLSEKLKVLEKKESSFSPKLNNLVKPPVASFTCSFEHTCYAAKFGMGSCPCELYQQESSQK